MFIQCTKQCIFFPNEILPLIKYLITSEDCAIGIFFTVPSVDTGNRSCRKRLAPNNGKRRRKAGCGIQTTRYHIPAGRKHDLRSVEIIPLVRDSHKSNDFIDFLKTLDGKYPEGDIIWIVLDNHTGHTCKKLSHWSAQSFCVRLYA